MILKSDRGNENSLHRARDRSGKPGARGTRSTRASGEDLERMARLCSHAFACEHKAPKVVTMVFKLCRGLRPLPQSFSFYSLIRLKVRIRLSFINFATLRFETRAWYSNVPSPLDQLCQETQ